MPVKMSAVLNQFFTRSHEDEDANPSRKSDQVYFTVYVLIYALEKTAIRPQSRLKSAAPSKAILKQYGRKLSLT